MAATSKLRARVLRRCKVAADTPRRGRVGIKCACVRATMSRVSLNGRLAQPSRERVNFALRNGIESASRQLAVVYDRFREDSAAVYYMYVFPKHLGILSTKRKRTRALSAII